MAGCIIKQEEALSMALGESFKDIDHLVNLSEKIVCIKISIAIFACLEDNLSFSDKDKVV